MSRRQPGTPPFVYFVAHPERDERVCWVRCPVLRIEDGMLIFGSPAAACRADLKQDWVPIATDIRRPDDAGRVDYAALQDTGVQAIDSLDQPGVSTNVFLRPRAIGLSPEDAEWVDSAFMPVDHAR